jgi:hypothetical protein
LGGLQKFFVKPDGAALALDVLIEMVFTNGSLGAS